MYTIYNASAGSGKTYSLVKAYLAIILKQTPNFKQLLAITFTNKAVFEMKNRIIELLGLFASDKVKDQEPSMFKELRQELGFTVNELQQRSQRALQYILHNYASFNISTIDAFNHQLIRHFSHDLHLNPFFEVQLESTTILQQAVDNLLSRAGTDKALTQWLIAFSNEKINEDKSWDTTQELLKIAQLLTVENHHEALQTLKDKTLTDFAALKRILQQHKHTVPQLITQEANNFLTLMSQHQLTAKEFNRGYPYKFFEDPTSLPHKKIDSWDTAVWQQKLLNDEKLYTDKVGKTHGAIIDSLHPQIKQHYLHIKKLFAFRSFIENALKYLPPLALLNQIQAEISLIKDEENILPIWEFNSVISSELMSQAERFPHVVPFIYERIGEKFRHYFIDEFQDTSVLQWKNLLPLVKNALQSEEDGQVGSLLLVGDAKQSIYRWRGGKAEQFISLYEQQSHPFDVELHLQHLTENYRSLPQIITFNNAFFASVASEFETETYRKLYENAQQQYPKSKENQHLPEGYVEVTFVTTKSEESEESNQPDQPNTELDSPIGITQRELIYCEQVLQKIQHALAAGAAYKDITVLTRYNREGAAVAAYLSQHTIKVISPDSLLLKNVPAVQFLIALLRLLYQPESQQLKLAMLFDYLRLGRIADADAHQFLSTYVNAPVETFFSEFGFSVEKFNEYSLYEGVAFAVQCFNLPHKETTEPMASDAYLSDFINLLFDFKNARKGGLSDFLEYWNEKQEELSISLPEGLDAVTILSVHKSKGLSAPVIIYPFADNVLKKPRTEMLWCPVLPEEFAGFTHLLVGSNKSMEQYEPTQSIYQQFQEEQLLDNLNVLYVALTRPISMLYVISALPEVTTEKAAEKVTYGTLLEKYLSSSKATFTETFTASIYAIGTPAMLPVKETKKNEEGVVYFQQGWATPQYKIATGASLLWDTHQQEAIERGNIIHQLLANIYYAEDLPQVLADAQEEGMLSAAQVALLAPQLQQLLTDEKLKPFYTHSYNYWNEREFIDQRGRYYRPDRLAYDANKREIFIIDYKTGEPQPQYAQQLAYYAHNLETLGWKVKAKYLVYIATNEVILLK